MIMKLRHRSPALCMMCRYYACYQELPVCKHCLADLQSILTEPCRTCGRGANECECTGEDSHRFMFFYNSFRSRRLMYFLKYNADDEAIRFISELAVEATGLKMSSFDGITYVPRLRSREKRYGYDQSKKVATELSRIYGIPVIHALRRVGGREQKLLSASERRKNIIGRYQLRLDRDMTKRYKKILLVDDIYTTGATVKACKRILLDNVAEAVVPFTFAKTNFLKS